MVVPSLRPLALFTLVGKAVLRGLILIQNSTQVSEKELDTTYALMHSFLITYLGGEESIV